MPKVTIAEVAHRAGVSAMTVSRVVNNSGEVRPETRSRILRVIAETGYRPNGIARSLSTRKTMTVGLVVPDLTNPFFPDVVRGAEDQAFEQGYTLYVSDIAEQPAREERVLERLEASRVDGVIVCASRLPDERLGELLALHPAAVVVSREAPVKVAGTVANDDTYGAMRAVHHLLQSGRERIGMLAGPPASRAGRLRSEGYENALSASGHPVESGWLEACDSNEHGGYSGFKRLLERHPDLQAVFGYNDLVALGALQAALEMGLRVPEDIGIVGYDDIRMAALATPALTTLRVNRYGLGAAAFKMLLSRIAGELPPAVLLRPELVVRQSA